MSATASTVNGSAKAGRDYTAVSVPVVVTPMQLTQTVSVPILNDIYAEPTEAFTVQLSGLTHASPGTTVATVTISDDDGPRVEIDPALPGDYFAHLWATSPAADSYLQIYNPHDVAVTARVTYIRRTARGWSARMGWARVSDWACTSTMTPSCLRGYFAEGATGLSVGFDQWFEIFNPTNDELTVTLKFYTTAGLAQTATATVPSGPGNVGVHVTSLRPQSEHSTVITAVDRDTGVPRAITAERLMRWHQGIEGHNSAGQRALTHNWEFLTGGSGLF